MCMADDLAEKLAWVTAQAIGAGVVFGLTVGTFFPLVAGLALGRFTLAQIWAAPKSDVLIAIALMGVITLLWTIWAFQHMWAIDEELRNWRFGMRGEQAVAENLADRAVAAAGYVAFHDVPGDGDWNLDHVVVGPGGVFVLETKSRSRRKATNRQEEHEVFFDGRVLEFPWCNDWEAAKQVERNARWVSEFLSGFAPKDLQVQPVIVVPGWFVRAKGNYSTKVMNAKYLVGYLSDARRVLTPEETEPLVRRFDERCRTLEF